MLIWAMQEHCYHVLKYTTLSDFHSGYATGSGLILFGRTQPIGVIVFSRHQFIIITIRSCYMGILIHHHVCLTCHCIILETPVTCGDTRFRIILLLCLDKDSTLYVHENKQDWVSYGM